MDTKLFGSLEKQVIEVLWKAEKPLKPLEVKQQLKGDHAYTTIMTVLKRMSDKKILTRKMEGKAYLYVPCTCKDKYIKSSLANVFGDLRRTYGELAISQFVDVMKTNKDDLKLLRQFLDNPDEKAK